MPGAEEVVVRETALERVGVGRLVEFVCCMGTGERGEVGRRGAGRSDGWRAGTSERQREILCFE